MNYWLVKTEPETYSWDNLVRDKKSGWDGVRNFQARNHLKAMKNGDLVFIYHSGDERSIMGIAKVVKEAYPEANDEAWVTVDLVPEKKIKNTISLAQIKADKKLSDMVLVKASRLSVQPVKQSEFEYIEAMSQKP